MLISLSYQTDSAVISCMELGFIQFLGFSPGAYNLTPVLPACSVFKFIHLCVTYIGKTISID